MTDILVPGANRPVSSHQVALSVDGGRLGTRYGVAFIPVGAGSPDAPFASASGAAPPAYLSQRAGAAILELPALSPQTEHVLLVLYAVRGSSTLRDLGSLPLTVDGSRIDLPNEAHAACAHVFAEVYRRNGAWKLRAKCDPVTYGLADLGRRLGKVLDDSGPLDHPGHGGGPSPHPHPLDGHPHPDWTGSGFVVAPGLVLTNAHVVDGASQVVVSGFDGKVEGTPILVDRSNDLALVRAPAVTGDPLPFRMGAGPMLGESAVTFGYPLAGMLGSGPQVTQGTVSGLLGPGEDASILQISAPIQPGSSGGPLLDSSGRVMGVVVATLSGGQNVNFAVRSVLAEAIIEAAGHEPLREGAHAPLDLSVIARMVRKSVWRLECRR